MACRCRHRRLAHLASNRSPKKRLPRKPLHHHGNDCPSVTDGGDVLVQNKPIIPHRPDIPLPSRRDPHHAQERQPRQVAA